MSDYRGKLLFTLGKARPFYSSRGGDTSIREVVKRCLLPNAPYFLSPSDCSNKQSEDILKVMQLEANRACIKDLSIEKLSTRNGDIAYTWHLMNIDTAGRYEEGDVIGIFPDSNHPDDKTFIDFLTPNNYKDATLAGVITRSYYLTANSREGRIVELFFV